MNNNQELDIVLIDSGIDAKNKIFQNASIVQYIYCEKTWIEAQDFNPIHGHGTAIAAIILKDYNRLQMKSFVLFEDKLQVNIEKLISALEYVNDNINCKIVHMSFGVKHYSKQLDDICSKLAFKGVILVSASSNSGAVSFPSAFPFVLSIGSTWKCKRSADFIYVNNNDVINLFAKGGNQRVVWLNNLFVIARGTSYAAAHVTRYIVNLLKSDFKLTYKDILENMKKVSVYQINNDRIVKMPKKRNAITKGVVFPFNKETESLVRFSSLLNFEFIDIYDSHESGKLNKAIKSDDEHTYVIKNIDNCNWDDFDTLIMGHTHDLEKLTNKAIRDHILEKCLKHHKNVYCFDNESFSYWKEKFEKENLFLDYPHINNVLTDDNFRMLYHVNVPVLAILGTSNKQGKFTLQLNLRKRFLQDGYTICQLGSEPESLLFGMDEVYPFGYRSNIKLSPEEQISYLSKCMFELSKHEPDIIIVGSQAGTIPFKYDNVSNFPIDRLQFLFGTLPDAVILCINYHDRIEDIKRAILAIESLVKCRVIACSLFPMGFQDDWDMIKGIKGKINENLLSEFSIKVHNIIDKPCFILDDKDDIDNLYDATINFFNKGRDNYGYKQI